MSQLRDDVPPWSYFLPITLAVIVGVLAADAIRYGVGLVFGGDDAPRQVEARRDGPPPVREPVAAPAAGDVPRRIGEAAPRQIGAPAPAGDPGAIAEPEPEPVAPTPPGVAPDGGLDAAAEADDGVRELPDTLTARRNGDPAACVNGTVVNRIEGGWEQLLENDAPVPCVVAQP